MNKKRKLDICLDTVSDGVGSIVWGKLGSHKWWPAIVISASHCKQPETKENHLWLFWFETHNISELSRQRIIDFSLNFAPLYAEVSGKKLQAAVMEALKVIANRCNFEYSDDEKLLSWARMGFKTSCSNDLCISEIPPSIIKYLDLKYENQNADRTNCAIEIERPLLNFDSNNTLKSVQEGLLKIEDICISCLDTNNQVVIPHPLFHGGLCIECKERFMENFFTYGDDGKNVCCVICCEPGRLVLCDSATCPRSYCIECISLFISPQGKDKIVETSPWLCFFCCKYKMDCGLIQIKTNWEENIFCIFQPSQTNELQFSATSCATKESITVLSLFDGISTGKLALDRLGLVIEKYFSFEIDEDAIHVSKLNHGDSIIYCGDVNRLTEEKIKAIGPIDLILGGSPCNDLSLVNHAKKGLFDFSGTGQLFFDFFHVLKTVQRLSGQKHVYFLYENVANMETICKDTISNFLMVEPALVDAIYFSPQSRPRYFWGNIPGLFTLNQYTSVTSASNNSRFNNSLSNFLIPNMSRLATVETIRTVTTQTNSNFQSSFALLPVKMNGEPDVLWITELEKIFGFPVHYTDTGNLTPDKRRKLLGRAWSVQVIEKILRPLLNFYKIY